MRRRRYPISGGRALRPSPLVWALALLSIAAVAEAAEIEVGPRLGWRFGGSVTEASTNRDISLDSAVALGLTIDFGLQREGSYLQFFWSGQQLEIQPTDSAEPPLDLDIHYLHFGGVYRWEGERLEKYLLGTFGITLLDSDATEVLPSGSLGAGLHWNASERVGLRLDIRGMASLETSEVGFRCSGGCLFTLAGGGMFQTEIAGGLSFRF